MSRFHYRNVRSNPISFLINSIRYLVNFSQMYCIYNRNISNKIPTVSVKALIFRIFVIDTENQFITPSIVVIEYDTVFCTIITLR